MENFQQVAEQAYEINNQIYDAAHTIFAKYQTAGLIHQSYSFDKYELDASGIEITGSHYSCGDTDYESFHVPYADLNDIDGFIERRKAEVAEVKRQKEAKAAAEQEKKKAQTEQAERQTYLTLKAKYEGVTQ